MVSGFDMSVGMSLSRKPRWWLVNFEKELCVLDGGEVLVGCEIYDNIVMYLGFVLD